MPDDTSELAKIGNLLALLLTKDMPKGATVLTLHSAGYSTKDIASLTGSAENAVRAALSAARKKSTERSSSKPIDG
jgi:DNA-directed RNA polymerase specialized sigma24 family protein